ncbi:MAG: NAD-dependent epimerase/dehydratase family protein, partial [Acidobacteria bacterium]|nr:NAD-dependent epimerase/dehydratase family protein [Acidobacteriota bacterium]
HKENINPKARHYEMDLRDENINKIFKDEKIDIVYHFAAQVKVVKSIENPNFDLDVNLGGSMNLLRACVENKVKKVIYSSTGGAVYGDPKFEDLPVPEEYPLNPLSYYGIHKHTVEHYLYLFKTNYGLDYSILRYPNVYGPRQDPHGEAGVVAIFSILMLEGRQPTIFGDGGKTRDYVYVADVVKGNLAVLENGSGEIFNLGHGISISDQDVFDTLQKTIKTDLKPIYADKRTGEVEHISLNPNKIKNRLGWKPDVDFKTGCEKSVEYYRDKPAWIKSF